ncbi:MAG: holo-[acyl-carrier-protein] synthase [Ruminococcaceae bacterium]|nr:holo-[acyl-carrier-protein] synthase [Oscillospiraceae bacterium]
MYGIGVDIVSIARIEKSLEKESFLKKVYGKAEIALFAAEGRIRANSLAANFAAKEAFSKALGTGVRGFDFDEVQILRNDLGAPYFKFDGRAKQIVEKNSLDCKVSLSHEKDKAIAFVVVEEKR